MPPEASPTGIPPTAQPGTEPPAATVAAPSSLAGSEKVPLLRMFGPATFSWEAAAVSWGAPAASWEAPAVAPKGTHILAAHVTAAARYFVFIVYLPF